ncbi:hypothetical protein GCM10027169_38220 [Gordonia jinhuaensis]|uniref:Uncharacterized protein n=1 Tax=Gordonia jinhuaensis TaxID=1517702 RepID=A0A916T1A4_9ACTN|nr:hypothetical protein GCM10011489_12210 [Gordonia jinhuaensis]
MDQMVRQPQFADQIGDLGATHHERFGADVHRQTCQRPRVQHTAEFVARLVEVDHRIASAPRTHAHRGDESGDPTADDGDAGSMPGLR